MMGTESMFGSTYASGMVCHDRTCCWCTDLARSAVAINRRMSVEVGRCERTRMGASVRVRCNLESESHSADRSFGAGC